MLILFRQTSTLQECTIAQTLRTPGPLGLSLAGGMVIVIMATIALLLLFLLIVGMICCCYIKKRKGTPNHPTPPRPRANGGGSVIGITKGPVYTRGEPSSRDKSLVNHHSFFYGQTDGEQQVEEFSC